jgi:hypothetical protein
MKSHIQIFVCFWAFFCLRFVYLVNLENLMKLFHDFVTIGIYVHCVVTLDLHGISIASDEILLHSRKFPSTLK